MKKFNEFILEMDDIHNLEDLEWGADLFQSNVNRGAYTAFQVKSFNDIYWDKKDQFLTNQLKSMCDIKYLRLFSIIHAAPRVLKNDILKLRRYIYNVEHGFKGQVAL